MFALKNRYTSYQEDPEYTQYLFEVSPYRELQALLDNTKKQTALLIHDSDPDGYCSAALLNQELILGEWEQFTTKAVAHGSAFHDFKFKDDEFYTVIFVLDHEVTPEIYARLKRHCHHLVVFDHHLGTEATAKEAPLIFYDDRWSTTALVDGFMELNTTLHRHPVVAMVDHYDKWRFGTDLEYDETVHCLISRIFLDGPSRTPWDKLLHMKDEDLMDFLEEGRTIRKIQDRQIEAIAEKYTYFAAGIIDDEPRTFAVVLHSDFYDRLGNYLIEKNPSIDFVVIAKLSKSNRPLKLHFRSRDDRMDVRKLAVSLGGGGHRNSSGVEIQIKDLPALLAPFKFSFM